MGKIMVILSVMLLFVIGCRSNETELSKVRWSPTIEDVINEPNIKFIVFLKDRGITPEGNLGTIKDWQEIGRIDDPRKIERIQEAFETAHCCRCEDDCVNQWPTWIGAVNKNNQGLLINFGWQNWSKRAEWRTHYSEELYKILVEYQIIKPEK